MSFLFFISQPTHKKNFLGHLFRKEEDSTKTQPTSPYFPKGIERASLFASFRGSVSVEAAFVIPIFFFAVCCLCYLVEIMYVQSYVHSALHNAGKGLAKEAYMSAIAPAARAEADMVENIGSERMDRSIIEGGSRGLDCSGTKVWVGTGIIQMHVKYEVVLPITFFGRLSLSLSDEFRIKGWTGYTKGGLFSDREDMVYVSETGIVYHKDYHCSHLELSIQLADAGNVSTMRNENGEKYYSCERCGGQSNGGVYITKQGNRYHSSLGCSGLKRSVYSVPLSEVMGKGACKRCG